MLNIFLQLTYKIRINIESGIKTVNRLNIVHTSDRREVKPSDERRVSKDSGLRRSLSSCFLKLLLSIQMIDLLIRALAAWTPPCISLVRKVLRQN